MSSKVMSNKHSSTIELTAHSPPPPPSSPRPSSPRQGDGGDDKSAAKMKTKNKKKRPNLRQPLAAKRLKSVDKDPSSALRGKCFASCVRVCFFASCVECCVD